MPNATFECLISCCVDFTAIKINALYLTSINVPTQLCYSQLHPSPDSSLDYVKERRGCREEFTGVGGALYWEVFGNSTLQSRAGELPFQML